MIERFSSQQNILASRHVENINSTEKRMESKIEVHEQVYEIKQRQSKEEMKDVIESINAFMQPSHTSLKFELHEKLNDYYVQVIDDDTKEVIREIPSKKMLDMHAAMKEFLGLMIDKKI